jgi:hypothetical protein
MSENPSFEGVPVVFNLAEMSIYLDLKDRLMRVTPQQIEESGRRLKPNKAPKGRVIGEVTQTSTRALWTLSRLLTAEIALERALAAGAPDEISERDHKQKAALLDMFDDVAGQLWWAQAKIDLGFYEEVSVGVRAGWLLVREPQSGGMPSLPAFMAQIGGMPPDPE